MKPLFLCTALALWTVLSTLPLMANDSSSSGAAPKARNARLLHVVSFKFKDAASREQIKQVEEAFRALKTKIPQIENLQWGLNNSPEGLNKGFTHGWILTFGSEADRDGYLKHPDHVEFGKLVTPVLADVFVIDFWGND